MRLLCERVVNDVLPAVRSAIAKELQDKGYSQTEIAALMDITQPAVSQYLSAARGKHLQRIEQHPHAADELDRLIEGMTSGAPDDELSRRLHDLCVMLLDEDCDAQCV